MNPMLNIAVTAARKAGDIINRYSDRVEDLEVQDKGRNEFVSKIDQMAEEAIIDTIKMAFRDHSIIGEESGHHKGDSAFEWVIDPLDGTTNYLAGIPQFSVSIAAKKNDQIILGVIFDPNKDELFTASKGEGAKVNQKRIRIGKRKSLEGSLLGTGFPYRGESPEIMDMYFNTLKALLPGTSGIRRPGSAALDLAYVAAGRYDGFWEMNLSEWDIAAGVLMIQEAGGLVGDFSGGHTHMQTGDIVAANPRIFKEMIKRIHPHVKNYPAVAE